MYLYEIILKIKSQPVQNMEISSNPKAEIEPKSNGRITARMTTVERKKTF